VDAGAVERGEDGLALLGLDGLIIDGDLHHHHPRVHATITAL
jgi:hypothetical protein